MTDTDPSPPAASSVTNVADGVRRQLPLEQIAAETVAWWITVACVGGVSLIVLVIGLAQDWCPSWLDVLAGGLWLGATGGACWLATRWPGWEHRRTAYAVHAAGIDIWQGLVWRRVISVPRSRVQHTDVEQGPLQRRYGLATLVIHTAGKDEAKVQLSGLRHATALLVRDFLIHEADGGPGPDDGV
jgi:hypothetical protein